MIILESIANEINRMIPNATIYIERQEQAFEEPSFYVHEINTTSDDELMDYQMRRHSYCIMYFPDSKNEDVGIREQCETMREILLNNFNFLVDHKLKPKNKESKILDDTLQLTFSLSYRVVDYQDKTMIKDLELNLEGE